MSPTNYPSSIDSLVDPTSGEFQNNPSHSTIHADANDAIVAIQTFVGTSSAPKFATTTSPTFVGTPLTPTPTTGSTTTQIANASFVTAAVLVETTRAEAAEALKANIASPTFTGTPSGPTATVGTNTTQLATTAFVLANAGTSGEFEGELVYDIGNYGTIDPTGSVDSTAAILAAIAAAAANAQGGVVWLRPGIFKISSTLTVNSPYVSIVGAGRAATILEPTSALNGSTVLEIQMSPFPGGAGFIAGNFTGFTIDGTNTSGSVGCQYGDIVGGTLDIVSQNFRGSNAIGIKFVNNTSWTEENTIRCAVLLNTTGAWFGAGNSGTNSFGYNDIDLFVRCGGGVYNNQVGISISTAIQIYNRRFKVSGNLTNISTGILGVTSGTTYGGLVNEQVDICFEINDSSGVTPISQPNYFQWYTFGTVSTYGGNSANSVINSPETMNHFGTWDVPGGQPNSGIFYPSSGGPIVAGNPLQLTAGTDTSGTASASAPTFVSGTARQLNTTQDAILYIEVTTGSSLAVAIGPTSTPANTLISTITAALGMSTIRVPKGWYVKITGTIADLNITAVSC